MSQLQISIYLYMYSETCKDHPRDQQNVVHTHRWSLYSGLIPWKLYPWGPVNCGLYKQVVFIHRWSLIHRWCYAQVVFRASDCTCVYWQFNDILIFFEKKKKERKDISFTSKHFNTYFDKAHENT